MKETSERKQRKSQAALENARRKEKEKYLKQTSKAEAKKVQAAEAEKRAQARRASKLEKEKKEAEERSKKGLSLKRKLWRQPIKPKLPKTVKPPKRVKPPKIIYPKLKLNKNAKHFSCLTKADDELIDMEEEEEDT